jgi:hypothetical protein
MRSPKLMQLVTLLLLTSFANSGCVGDDARSKLAINLPAPPKFMGACAPSGVKVGDPPNIAFNLEHAALKQCSRAGAASRDWYLGVKKRYAGAKLK